MCRLSSCISSTFRLRKHFEMQPPVETTTTERAREDSQHSYSIHPLLPFIKVIQYARLSLRH